MVAFIRPRLARGLTSDLQCDKLLIRRYIHVQNRSPIAMERG